jgi:hypothetical protein
MPNSRARKLNLRANDNLGFFGEFTQETEETQEFRIWNAPPKLLALYSYTRKSRSVPAKTTNNRHFSERRRFVMIDKRAVWEDITAMVEAAVGTAFYYTLVSRCWLDSLEGDTAIVATDTEFMVSLVRKRASRALGFAFSEYKGAPVSVQIVQGNPRIHAPMVNPEDEEYVVHIRSQVASSPYDREQAEKCELAILHQRYGDIMGIVDNHPLFKRACRDIDKGGWGIFPQLLTNACKDYGVIAVRNGLSFVANRPSAKKPRALFFTLLREGKFGHRLVVGANHYGPGRALEQEAIG